VTVKALARATSHRHHFLGLAATALTAAVVLSACSSGGGKDNSSSPPASGSGGTSQSGSAPGGSGTPSSSASTSKAPQKPRKPVHVSLFEGDGQTYGIGMAIIAQFSKHAPTSAHAWNKVVTVKVNGQPANGAWFWVKSNTGYLMEAQYRMQSYWPAHSHITMNMPLKGVDAGPGLAFEDSLTLSMNIGAAHVSTVDGSTERMDVTSDGKSIKTLPVSLGKASTPTYLGTKVVMEKKNPQLMVSAPGEANPYSLKVPWSVRVTLDGEFVHSASWNGGNIGSRSTSHGCTNLNVGDAKWFYNFAVIGDIVKYSNTQTSNVMPSWDGYGWWNVPWPEWKQGNLLKN
jgi:lipoprotein-anchoring transpeptidase ErfK/SrfK